MKWIKDFEGNLINALSVDFIFIDQVGTDYPKPYRVCALIQGEEFLINHFEEHIDAKDLVVDLWLKLNRYNVLA